MRLRVILPLFLYTIGFTHAQLRLAFVQLSRV